MYSFKDFPVALVYRPFSKMNYGIFVVLPYKFRDSSCSQICMTVGGVDCREKNSHKTILSHCPIVGNFKCVTTIGLQCKCQLRLEKKTVKFLPCPWKNLLRLCFHCNGGGVSNNATCKD